MAFFDRPDLKPSAFNGIKIQDFDNNGNGLQHGIDGSGEYAMNKNAILCFASNYEWGTNTSKRVVTFKGFIENLKINGNLTREIEENFWNAQVIDYLTSFEISYSLSFNVVAHSVNDAKANLARYSELLRIISFPTDANNEVVKKTEGFQNTYVLLNNLISNGRMWKEYNNPNFKINSETILLYGLHVSVAAINMSIDAEMGFFEFGKQMLPKVFTISMELSVPNKYELSSEVFSGLEDTDTKFALLKEFQAGKNPDTQNLFFDFKNLDDKLDARGFPFNVPIDYWDKEQAGYLSARNLNVSTNPYSQTKKIYFGVVPELETFFGGSYNAEKPNLDNSKVNYVLFDAFLESFDLSATQSNKKSTANSSQEATTNFVFSGNTVYTYNVELKIPADSLIAAKRNCAKLAYLTRFVTIVTDKPKTRILMANLVKDPKDNGINTIYTASTINSWGLQCQVHTCDIDIDLDAGFFEDNGFLYPKVLTLNMQFNATSNKLGHMIYRTAGDDPKNKLISKEDSIYWPFGVNYDNISE